MANEEFYDDGEFFINLTIDGTEWEDNEVKVTDPQKPIRELIKNIIQQYELPKYDNGNTPIEYKLGKVLKDGNESEMLALEDENGREQNLLDYNVKSGDSLHLTSIPIAG